ncbi:DUF421 domain-containing protein [Micrococcoides hystricis]|uniref:DUF421 domain-containing protein n=1 Tax=Micrococcoides hystricis TaxID=1572761 RepID=A0ABV6P817_9MICC
MEIVVRAAIAFGLLWLLAKASGKGTLGEMSSFDLLVFVVMGDLIAPGITGEDRTLTGGVLAVATFALLAVGMNYLSARWRKVDRLIEGYAIILVKDGVVDESALRRQRITTEELKVAARQAQLESMDDIRLALLETNGKISIFPRA